MIVVGATTPFYADERNALPTIDQPATDTEPGWEDWDEDGNPAVSLHVSGLVEGERYTALRSFILWSGSIPSGAMTFRLPVSDWGQEESVLGVTAYHATRLSAARSGTTTYSTSPRMNESTSPRSRSTIPTAARN